MAWLPISGTAPQYSTASNGLADDYYIKFYASGTTTPINMATDSTGGTKLAKCALSAEGYPITNPLDDSTKFIPHIDQDYRIVMYTNETDADNNTTASAAFNIDGMVLQVTPTGDAADITLRDVTIEQQDDYDRSPLFIDVTDFTAGAGPHVITVPTDWTPTNADMRFYRLDNSGIVTALTPSSTSSTTFTLAETLLSTDVIFIGDDDFRDFHTATEDYVGVIEKATAAEMTAATADKFPDAAVIQGYYGALEYEEVSYTTLGGPFTSGSIHVSRIGRVVTISSSGLSHSSTSYAVAATDSLPLWADPLVSVRSVLNTTGSLVTETETTTSRVLSFLYRDWAGSSVATASTGKFTFSYISVA